MITYSDYILAQNPTLWCPMDSEPVELIENVCYFLDYSGNNHHDHVRMLSSYLSHYESNAFEEIGLGGVRLNNSAYLIDNFIFSHNQGNIISYKVGDIVPMKYGEGIEVSPISEPSWDIYGNPNNAPSWVGMPNSITHMRVEFLFRDLVIPKINNTTPGTFWCQLFSVGCFTFAIIATWVKIDPECISNCEVELESEPILVVTINRYIYDEVIGTRMYRNIIGQSPIDLDELDKIQRISFDYETDTWTKTRVVFSISLNGNAYVRSTYNARYIISETDLIHFTYQQISETAVFHFVEPFFIYFGSNCAISALSFTRGTTFNHKNISPDYQIEYDLNRNTSIQNILFNTDPYWDDTYTGIDLEYPTQTIIKSTEINASAVSDKKGTMIVQFNKFMIDGTCQTLVRQIQVQFSTENNCYEIFVLLGSIEVGTTYFSEVKKCDWIELGRSSQPGLNRKWKVHNVFYNSISFLTERSDFVFEDCYDKVVVIKKIAIRDTGSYLPEVFSWTKQGNHLMCSYHCEADNKSFTLDDTNEYRITEFESLNSYLKRNMKKGIDTHHYYVFPSIWNDKIYQWRVLGTSRQIYLSLGYARDEIDFHLLFVIGSIKDFFTDTWDFVIQGYKISSFYYGTPGETQAYLYSNWSVLSTGHLLCRHCHTNDNSGTFFLANETYLKVSNSSDLGCMIYPDPFLKIEDL